MAKISRLPLYPGPLTGNEQIPVRRPGGSYLITLVALAAFDGPPPPTAPSNIVAPSISGNFVEGQFLTVDLGDWLGTAPIAFDIQWTRNGAEIEGAKSPTYMQVGADVGAIIDCDVTATNAAGSTAVSATGEGPVAAAPIGEIATIFNTLSNSNLPGNQVEGFIEAADEIDARITVLENA